MLDFTLSWDSTGFDLTCLITYDEEDEEMDNWIDIRTDADRWIESIRDGWMDEPTDEYTDGPSRKTGNERLMGR